MAIARVNYATHRNTSGGTTIVVNKPTSTADGNVMIAIISCSSNGDSTTTLAAPSGWTALSPAPLGGPLGRRTWAFWKVAASEGTSYTFTSSGLSGGSEIWIGIITTYSGNHTTAPIDGSGTNSGAQNTTPTLASVTPSTNKDMHFSYLNAGNNPPHTWTGSPTLTAFLDDNGTNFDAGQVVSDLLLTTSSATTAYTTTDSNPWNAWTILIKPPPDDQMWTD